MNTTDLIQSARRALNAGDFAGSLAALDEIEAALLPEPGNFRRAPAESGPKPKIAFGNALDAQDRAKRDRVALAHVALCVGHSRGDKGAVSVGGETEWSYNLQVAGELQAILKSRGIRSTVIAQYQGGGYEAAMRWLGGECKRISATLAIELHFNSANGKAKGFEFLRMASSKSAVRLAWCLAKELERVNPAPNRGVKEEERGKLFLRMTPCPAVIAEPFFGDAAEEWKRWGSEDGQRILAEAYATGIENYLQG